MQRRCHFPKSVSHLNPVWMTTSTLRMDMWLSAQRMFLNFNFLESSKTFKKKAKTSKSSRTNMVLACLSNDAIDVESWKLWHHHIRQRFHYTITIYIYCPVWRETRRFVPPWKFMSPEGEARWRHEFSGWDKSSCLPPNWAINCLLYRRALCRETRQGNTTSGGKHDDLFSLHVTSIDQSYFFIRHIN